VVLWLLCASPAAVAEDLPRIPNSRAARLLVLLSLLNAAGPDAGSVADLDRKNGFRDLRFGDGVASIADLEQSVCGSEPGGGLAFYSRKTDKKRIGNAQVERIGYGFEGRRLSQIVIYAHSDPGNAAALLDVVERAYGQGTAETAERTVWDGRRVHMSLATESGQALLVIRSKAVRAT
jgi:hypothetical protein